MSTIPNATESRHCEGARALVQAQGTIRAIPHDARNEFHKYAYTSSEAIIAECKAALTANGLALLPTGESHQVLEGGQLLPVRQFLLLHTSGEERALSTSWPVCPDKGRPADKATASAATTSLAYLLRDLLLAPRVDPADDLAGREDRPAVSGRKKTAATDPIGSDGAKKLLDLAGRKHIQLDAYLEPHGCKFTPLSEVSKEIGRAVYRQLQQLPDPPAPAAPIAAAGVRTNGHAVPPPRVSSTPF